MIDHNGLTAPDRQALDIAERLRRGRSVPYSDLCDAYLALRGFIEHAMRLTTKEEVWAFVNSDEARAFLTEGKR